MSWINVVKNLDIEHLKAVLAHIAVDWSIEDGAAGTTAATVIMEVAQRVGIDPRDVLTQDQVNRMVKKGIL